MACSDDRQLYVPAPPVSVFNFLCSQPKIGKMSFLGANPMGWMVQFKSGMSFTSWGESVFVQVFAAQDGNTLLHIHSESAMATTLIDYGKNANNVNEIANLVMMAFSRPMPPQI